MKYTAEDILNRLRTSGSPANVNGMARFGINPQGTLGISMPVLRQIAKEIGKDHRLAGELWESGVHEARILASLVDKASLVDEHQMERWVADFNSWDVCDQVCGNLFWRLPQAPQKAMQWSERQEEFVKRAGFVLMAELAVHDKKAGDELFESFFVPIEREADDGRNFVRKALIGRCAASVNAISLNGKAIRQPARLCRSTQSSPLDRLGCARELTEEKIQRN